MALVERLSFTPFLQKPQLVRSAHHKSINPNAGTLGFMRVHARRPVLVRASYERGKATSSAPIHVNQPIVQGETIALPTDEVRHLKARRVPEGTTVRIFNSAGTGGLCTILHGLRSVHVLQVFSRNAENTDPNPALSVCFCPPKSSSRADFAIEKLTEVGADRIFLMRTSRSHIQSKPSEAKLRRWSRLTVAAAKQCLRTSIPTAHTVDSFEQVVSLVATHDWVIVLSPDGQPLLAELQTALADTVSTLLLIAGPEGGLTELEESKLVSAGAALASLGQRRLRIETAIVAAVSAVSLALHRSQVETDLRNAK